MRINGNDPTDKSEKNPGMVTIRFPYINYYYSINMSRNS